MRRIAIVLLFGFSTLAGAAAPPPEGRWEGPVQIPGRSLSLVVDLALDKAGAWTGSIIVPGMGIKGAPLANLVVAGNDVTFDLGNALAAPDGPARFKAHLSTGDTMAGEMSQGGNVAPFSLKRIASAQVELPARSTAVAGEIADKWTGEFELGGYPRHVTITFENHDAAAATAQFVIVGKQTNNLPVDLVTEEGNLLRIESQSTQISFEGRYNKDAGEIRGTVELGPYELPLILRRAPRSVS